MNRTILDAVGKIDPRYIEEAAGVQTGRTHRRPDRGDETEQNGANETLALRSRGRSGWAVAAAALFLVAALGSGWLILSRGRPVAGTEPSAIQADTPGQSEAILKTDPLETSNPNAQSDDPEYNRLEIDFNAVLEASNSDAVTSACGYVQRQTPSEKNEMTGLLAGKNLILITAQNFSPYVIDPERTPTLYRLATQGIEFTDYYQPAWGGAAHAGEFSVLTGLVPAHGTQSIRETIGRDLRFTLGNQLQNQGYFSRAWCNQFTYDYADRNQTHENLGYEKFIGIGNGLEESMTRQWPYSDREMIDATVSEYLDRQPFSVYYMTCSGIGIYKTMGNKKAEIHWDEVEDLPCSDTVKAYLAANMELEYALRDLVAALEDSGIADETVIVLSSSEYPYALEENEDYGNFEDYLAELYGKPVENCFERDRSTLILWSGCLEGKNLKVTTPTSSLDIVPTLSNLFGLDYDSRLLVGRDVFSDQDPLVFWPDGSWKTDKAQYEAGTGTVTQADGEALPAGYAGRIAQTVQEKIKFSEAVLDLDLYRVLFSEDHRSDAAASTYPDESWHYTPAADPVDTVREALTRETEKDYAISLTLEELRLDDMEKELVRAGDLESELVRRNGYGPDAEALAALPPEDFAVVYAVYTVEYDHTKIPYLDGRVDQYFYLIRNQEGNWEINWAGYTKILPEEG